MILPPPAASVVIPTRERRDILRENLLAIGRQTVPVEIVVVDDGSTDGTPEMMRSEFPQVRYLHLDGKPHGPAFARNRGSEMARAPILFPIDDDAVMVSPRTVEQTLAEFNHPRVGAVGVPYINVRISQEVHQRAPDDAQIWVGHTFTGAAHAMRREVFFAVCGYREHFFYMGEEGDLTLRMLAAGWVTRLGRADPIEHHESPQRVTARADFYGRRNDVVHAWHNVPMPSFPIHLAGTIFNGLRAAVTEAQNPGRMLLGTFTGCLDCLRYWNKRQPVPEKIYRLSRRLKKRGPLPLEEIEGMLPSLK